MTRRREPLSLDAALTAIAARLPGGWNEMADACRRRVSLVRNWSDPERREQIPLRDAIVLDRAWRQAGGHGAPLFEFYADRLEAAGVLSPADRAALLGHAAIAIKECGEAHAAIIGASQPGATPAHLAAAQREVDQAIAVLQRARPMLSGRAAYSALLDEAARIETAGSLDPRYGVDEAQHPSTGPPP